MKRIPNHKMAEGTDEDRGQRFTWNLNDVPVAINMNGRDTTRMRENLSRVVRDLLPELANQPGTPLSTRIGSAQAVVSIGTTEGGASGGLHLPGHETRGHGRHLHFDGDHVHGNGGRGREGTSSSESSTDSRNPSASLVINLGGDNLSSQLGQEQGHIHIPEPDENQNTAGSPGHTHNNGGAQPLPIRSLYRMVEGSVPFILLLFAKIMYNHRLGILVFAGLYGTFHYANKTLRKHIAQRVMVSHTQEGPAFSSSLHLLWIIAFLTANIAFLYYVFQDQLLHNSLALRLPAVEHVDVWTLLWIVGITDFVIKFGAVVLKAVVALIPKFLLPHKKRGKFYMLIEHASQFYRCIVPIVPWIAFIQNNEQGGQWFAYFLLLIYIIFKTQQLWCQAKELRQGCSKFRVDVSYGSCPSRDDLSTADNCCPICQDKFTEPVKLSCKHIFCEECVSMWFDRERTCPMCRANIVDNPMWRDGTTSNSLQLF